MSTRPAISIAAATAAVFAALICRPPAVERAPGQQADVRADEPYPSCVRLVGKYLLARDVIAGRADLPGAAAGFRVLEELPTGLDLDSRNYDCVRTGRLAALPADTPADRLYLRVLAFVREEADHEPADRADALVADLVRAYWGLRAGGGRLTVPDLTPDRRAALLDRFRRAARATARGGWSPDGGEPFTGIWVR